MKPVKFLVDNLCANFTEQSVFELVIRRLAEGPCTAEDIAQRITAHDRSLDAKSASTLAAAAVGELAERGDIAVQGERLLLAGSART
ncbi:MAG: hypothetical protein HYY02_08745 [Chloroflexi bacterium]|nr:hypothetical protein [Chloroflexota bacterium]